MNNEGMEFLLFPGTESYEFKNESFENRPHIISVAVSVWVLFLYHSVMLGARDPLKTFISSHCMQNKSSALFLWKMMESA